MLVRLALKVEFKRLAERAGRLTTLLSKLLNIIRRKPVASTAIVGLIVQVGRPLVSLVTLPVLLAQLGESAFGLWLIALSLLGLIGFINAGISSAVVTAIARASTDDGGIEVRRQLSAAVLVATGWGLLVGLVAIPASFMIDWHRLLQLDAGIASNEVTRLMVALAATMSAGFVAAIPRQIMLGRQHGYLANVIDLGGILASTAALITGLYWSAPLWVLALAFLVPQHLVMLGAGFVYMGRAKLPFFSSAHLNERVVKSVVLESGRLCVYHFTFAVSSQSDLLLIGIILGAPAAAAYGVAQRIFALPILISTTVNYAQWPAMARVDAAGDTERAAVMFRRTLLFGSATATAVALAAALAYAPLTRAWLGQTIEADLSILSGMIAWVLVATLVNTSDSLLRARKETAFLMRCMVLMAILNIAATLALLPLIGPAGAVWGSVTGYSLALLLPYTLRLWPIIVGRTSTLAKTSS